MYFDGVNGLTAVSEVYTYFELYVPSVMDQGASTVTTTFLQLTDNLMLYLDKSGADLYLYDNDANQMAQALTQDGWNTIEAHYVGSATASDIKINGSSFVAVNSPTGDVYLMYVQNPRFFSSLGGYVLVDNMQFSFNGWLPSSCYEVNWDFEDGDLTPSPPLLVSTGSGGAVTTNASSGPGTGSSTDCNASSFFPRCIRY